jgi:hypothetical protein
MTEPYTALAAVHYSESSYGLSGIMLASDCINPKCKLGLFPDCFDLTVRILNTK